MEYVYLRDPDGQIVRDVNGNPIAEPKITLWMKFLDFIGYRRLTNDQNCSLGRHVWGNEKRWISPTWYEDYPFGEEVIYRECEHCKEHKYIRRVY